MHSAVPLLRCRYGAHLSRVQVAELVAPHPHTLNLVHSWLIHHGIPLSSSSMTHGGNTVTLTGVSITQADELLSASYQVYRHVKTNETIVRTISYSLPASLHAQVWTVVPTTHFASPHVREQTSWNRSDGATMEQASGEPVIALSSRDDGVTSPDFLRYLYNTWGYIPTAMSRNTLAVVGFLDDYPSRTDLTAFMRKYRTDGADAMFTVVEVNHGSYDPSNPNDEANLDIQYSQGIAYPTPQVFHSTGRGLLGTDDRYLSWINSVINQEAIPQTISISYGIYEKIYPRDYTAYLCSLFAQLGARGASVLMPSGNEAVGRNCVNSDRSIRFTPHFPATCTWSLSSTCKKHIRAGTVRSLQPVLCRSLYHCRRRHDSLSAGVCGRLFRWRLLGSLSTPLLAAAGCRPLPTGPRQPASRPLQVRSPTFVA